MNRAGLYCRILLFLYLFVCVNGAVYTIKSATSNLHICATAIEVGSAVQLLDDAQATDASGNMICYWSIDSEGHVFLAGGDGTLVIESAADTPECAGMTFSLSTVSSGNTAQTFGLVNTQYGEILRTAGGYGACAMDVLALASGAPLSSGIEGSSESQTFTITHLVCESGFYWNQDATSPVCRECPIGRSELVFPQWL
jgi:hypothetical protein